VVAQNLTTTTTASLTTTRCVCAANAHFVISSIDSIHEFNIHRNSPVLCYVGCESASRCPSPRDPPSTTVQS